MLAGIVQAGTMSRRLGRCVWDFVCLAASYAVALASAFAPTQAASDDLFKGKTLTVYVGAPVAGGYDTYGRLLGTAHW